MKPIPTESTTPAAESPRVGPADAPRPARLSVSVIIPVHNGEEHLPACLARVRELDPPAGECIVIDDGSGDSSLGIARASGCRVLSAGGRRGPAFARNLGAREARGDLLLFIDADVLAPRDLIARVREEFEHNPLLDAVIGSYDDAPGQTDFLSQYRNLLHCYVHQHSREEASTFWCGCGAIRREVFLRLGGFLETYLRPSVEDIELGWRLRRTGGRIRLRKDLQVKHMKRWSFSQILRTDFADRAVPWTMLILRRRWMPAELNLRWRYRFSVVLWASALAAAGFALFDPGAIRFAAAGAGAAVLSNAGFYRFLASRRGWIFALCAVPLHALHFLCSGAGFAAGLMLHVLRTPPAREVRR